MKWFGKTTPISISMSLFKDQPSFFIVVKSNNIFNAY